MPAPRVILRVSAFGQDRTSTLPLITTPNPSAPKVLCQVRAGSTILAERSAHQAVDLKQSFNLRVASTLGSAASEP